MRKRDTTAGKPAVTLPGIVTEQDRAIVSRRAAGETIQAIATSLGIPASQVMRAEHRAYRERRAQELFAKHPDSIEGLDWLGVLSEGAGPLRCHKYHYEGGDLERLSDVAALGRHYVSCLKGIGPKSLASIDRALGLFGIVWSPIDRAPKPLTPTQQREAESRPTQSGWWADIVGHVRDLERSAGTAALEGHPNRDSMEGIALRLAFLNGYMESAPRHRGRMIDVTPDDADDQDDASRDLETAGNLVCLPGVKLADILPQNGGSID